MMRGKKISGIIVFIYLTVLSSFQINAAGGVGSDFLRLEPPARTAAMSNAFAGISDDINSIIYNPAGLNSIKKVTVSFTHFSLFADSNCEFLCAAFPIENGKYGVIGGGVFVDYTFDFPYYDEYGDEAGTVDNYDIVATASYAYPIYDWLSAGVNLKYFHSKLYIYTKGGFAADLGIFLKMGNNPDTFAGIVLQNFGSQSAYIAVVDPLPTNIKAGMGIKIKIANVAKLALAVDVNRLISKDETPTLDVGADLNIFEILCLRAGYGFKHDISGFTLGIGVILDRVNFSYSFQPFDVLGSAHRISLDIALFEGDKKDEKQE